MKQPYRNRLLKLAKHLQSGKLGHAMFDMTLWNDVTEPKCGTSGCAIGECPIIFPRDWIFSTFGNPVLKLIGYSVLDSIGSFFGMRTNDAIDLFITSGRRYTRKQQARRILNFVKSQEKGR